MSIPVSSTSQRRPHEPHRSEGITVIRTSVLKTGFWGLRDWTQSCNKTLGRSQVLRASEDFFICSPRIKQINNWKAITDSIEAKGNTESWIYSRARAIADGKPDPMPNVSELTGGSAA